MTARNDFEIRVQRQLCGKGGFDFIRRRPRRYGGREHIFVNAAIFEDFVRPALVFYVKTGRSCGERIIDLSNAAQHIDDIILYKQDSLCRRKAVRHIVFYPHYFRQGIHLVRFCTGEIRKLFLAEMFRNIFAFVLAARVGIEH